MKACTKKTAGHTVGSELDESVGRSYVDSVGLLSLSVQLTCITLSVSGVGDDLSPTATTTLSTWSRTPPPSLTTQQQSTLNVSAKYD